MTILIIVILALAVVALYPLMRELLHRRRTTVPAYVEALQLLLDGERDKAMTRLKEAVAADPDNIDAWVRLGSALIEGGDVARGLRVHENLALRRNLRPDEEQQVYRALAADYVKTERRLKAISIMEELVRTSKQDRPTREALFRLYLETGSWEKCENLLTDLARNPPDRTWVAAMMAEYARSISRRDADAALRRFNEALRLDPGSVVARLYLGDFQLDRGDTEAAARTWHDIVTRSPEHNGLVRHRLERAYYELGRYDDVTSMYEELLRKVPGDEGLAVALALIYQKKENLAPAIQLLERTCRTDGQRFQCRLALASLYLSQGSRDRASAILAAMIDDAQATKRECPTCGTSLHEPSVRCPSCNADLLGSTAPGN